MLLVFFFGCCAGCAVLSLARYDDFVTSHWDVAAHKMKPEEHVVLISSHKAAYNRKVPARVTVERGLVDLWPYQMPSIRWDDIKIGFIPMYVK